MIRQICTGKLLSGGQSCSPAYLACVRLAETRRAEKARAASTRNGSEGTSEARRWRRAVASGVCHPTLRLLLSLLAADKSVSLRLIVFTPVPYRFTVSTLFLSLCLSLSPSLYFSLSRFLHTACGRVPLFLPLSSLSSLLRGSGRCRCPDVTSVTMSFNTRR